MDFIDSACVGSTWRVRRSASNFGCEMYAKVTLGGFLWNSPVQYCVFCCNSTTKNMRISFVTLVRVDRPIRIDSAHEMPTSYAVDPDVWMYHAHSHSTIAIASVVPFIGDRRLSCSRWANVKPLFLQSTLWVFDKQTCLFNIYSRPNILREMFVYEIFRFHVCSKTIQAKRETERKQTVVAYQRGSVANRADTTLCLYCLRVRSKTYTFWKLFHIRL